MPPDSAPNVTRSAWVTCRVPARIRLGRQGARARADLAPDDLWERVAPLLPPAPERRRRCPGGLRVPGSRPGAGCGTGPRLVSGPACTPPPPERTAPCLPLGPGRLRRGRLAHPGPRRGDHVGPSPVDRPRPGSKHHLIVDRNGIPLAVTLTGGNRHDVTQLLPLLDAVPPIRGVRGRPRRRPRRLSADRGYDFDEYRRLLVEARRRTHDCPSRH